MSVSKEPRIITASAALGNLLEAPRNVREKCVLSPPSIDMSARYIQVLEQAGIDPKEMRDLILSLAAVKAEIS